MWVENMAVCHFKLDFFQISYVNGFQRTLVEVRIRVLSDL